MLKSIGALRTEYSSDVHDIARELYAPCLRQATCYDRITGFFSSAVFTLLHGALGTFFMQNDGRMRLLCSPRLSEADAEGLLFGYEARDDAELGAQLRGELNALLTSPYSKTARLLAALIAAGRLEIRLARVTSAASPSDKRMFHDKVGIFRDASGEAVGFRGSMNESYLGLSPEGHIDSIDVWPSWEGGRDAERVLNATTRFARLWAGEVAGVTIASLPDELRVELARIAEEVDLEELLGDLDTKLPARPDPAPRLGDHELRPHQVRGADAWIAHGHRGLLAHATGSGKTITGLQCAQLAIDEGLVPVVLVPSALLLAQWAAEARRHLGARVILAGDGNTSWRTAGTLRGAVESRRAEQAYMVIAVMNTAATESFRAQLRPVAHRCLLIADEAHRLGSAKLQSILGWLDAPWRLGLSATPDRANDPEGTAVLMEYFGGIVDRYTLKDALDEGVLSPYRYLPAWVGLTEAEQANWDDLTLQIKKRYAIAHAPGSKPHTKEQLARKLIERARIAKNAALKVPLAARLITQHYRPDEGQKWLVYCDNRIQLDGVRMALESRGIPSWAYHRQMEGDPDATLRLFDTNGGIVVAIKCLDEGVDIPAATHALVLASSRNPREFIQRRGRILRRAPDKTVATLMDILVLPERVDAADPLWALSVSELSRALEFAVWSISRAAESTLEDKWVSMGLPLSELDAARPAGVEADEDESDQADG
jgi:superfamily II DNA or RNA helicase